MAVSVDSLLFYVQRQMVCDEGIISDERMACDGQMISDEAKFLFFLVQTASEARSIFVNALVHLYNPLVKKLHFASYITLLQEIIRNFNSKSN